MENNYPYLTNQVYIYDNDFISLLSLIKTLLKNKIRPYKIEGKEYNPSLFENIINIKVENNSNILRELKNIFGKENMQIIYYVYSSCENNKELVIYYYLLNYFKFKDNLIRMRNLRCVSEALRIKEKVAREAHKFKGFLRFKELKSESLYAEINPDNDILFILAKHFQKRLKEFNWVIKDVNRKTYAIYFSQKLYFANEEKINLKNVEFSKEEESYEDMWKEFYNIIGITLRKNDRCRMNFMPKKYWQYLIEMEDER